MRLLTGFLALALIGAIPQAVAEEPESAAAVWSAEHQIGTATVDVEPRNPLSGEQFVTTLRLNTTLDIQGITYQMCDVGSSCFAIGYPVESLGGGVWELRTEDEWKHSSFMDDGELRTFLPGERIGWQYFIELGNGTVLEFPHGEECDIYGTEEEWMACQETHYFAVDIGEAKATPWPSLLLVGVALIWMVRRRA